MDYNALLGLLFQIALVMVLVMLNGFFVAAEFAIVKIRDTQLETLIIKGHRGAQIVRQILNHLNSYLSAAQLGITLASLGLGWVGEPVFTALLAPVLSGLNIESPQARHTIAFIVGFSAITFLHITAGEQAPKALAIQKPLATALWISLPLRWFHRISFPFIWVLNQTSLWLLRQVGIEAIEEADRAHSEEELRLIFDAAQREAGGTRLGRDIVLNALELRRRIAREVMRPRQEIVGLNTNASLAECLAVAEKTRYSRFPLCVRGNLDETIGVVHIKDLFATRFKAISGADLAAVARKIIYVPETARLERLLQLFLEQKLHLAIVVDEYGGTLGMVTLENVLEELVGQIQDEFDQEKPLLWPVGEQIWELSGALPLHELSDLVGEPLQEEGITTTSGLVTQRLGGFPKAGDTLRLGSYELRVEAMDGPRVALLKLARLTADAGSDAPLAEL